MGEKLVLEGNLTITNNDHPELNFVSDDKFVKGEWNGESVESMILQHFAPGAKRWDWVRVGPVRITIEVLDSTKPHGSNKREIEES